MKTNILLIPKGFLGDIILTTPVIAALVRGVPGAKVSVVCTPATAEFVRRDPLVHEVIVYDRKTTHRGFAGLRRFATSLRDKNYEIAYSFHRSPRTAILLWLAGIKERVGYSDGFLAQLYTRRVRKPHGLHDVVRNLSLVQADLDEATQRQIEQFKVDSEVDVDWADLRVPEGTDDRLSPQVRSLIGADTPYIVLSPGSAWATKQWDAAGYNEVAAAFIARGVQVVLVGARNDISACTRVAEGLPVTNLCGETSLEELVEIIRNASCVVCNDSLALHISSATKTPVVAIFCATSPRFGFGPWRNKAVILEKRDLFCKPCRRHGGRSCPTGTRLCMTGVAASEVICAASSFLPEQGRSDMIPGLRVVES